MCLVSLHEIFRINVFRYEEHLWKFSLQKTSMKKVVKSQSEWEIYVIPHPAH